MTAKHQRRKKQGRGFHINFGQERSRSQQAMTRKPRKHHIPNKSAQSNLGRGLHRGTVAHVRRKVPLITQWRTPNSPRKVPVPVDRSPNPATCLIPGPVRPVMPPFFHSALDRPTHARTDRSSTGKFDHYRRLRYESDAA